MNKADLVAKVAEKSGVTKKDAEKAVAGIFAAVQEALVAGDKVQVLGFGTFEVKERAARTGRNPQTGEVVDIPEHKAVTFKPSPNFIKHCLNGHFPEEK